MSQVLRRPFTAPEQARQPMWRHRKSFLLSGWPVRTHDGCAGPASYGV